MLQLVDVGPRSLRSYRGIAPDYLIDDLLAIAKDLKGARVAQVNATPYGGGVSELLRSTVPIMNDLGLVAHWKTISGDNRFFQVTKKIHNGLQGDAEDLTEADREAYLGTSQRNAQLFRLRADDTARRVLQSIGIKLDRPLITQVSRFDPWKDPLGVIAVYQLEE